MLRKYHAKVDMLPQVMIAGLCSLALAFVLAPPFAASGARPRDPGIDGLRPAWHRLPARDGRVRDAIGDRVGLLALLEPILGPLWVWALMGERPGRAALAGSAIVLTAVIANEALPHGARRAREPCRRRRRRR